MQSRKNYINSIINENKPILLKKKKKIPIKKNIKVLENVIWFLKLMFFQSTFADKPSLFSCSNSSFLMCLSLFHLILIFSWLLSGLPPHKKMPGKCVCVCLASDLHSSERTRRFTHIIILLNDMFSVQHVSDVMVCDFIPVVCTEPSLLR